MRLFSYLLGLSVMASAAAPLAAEVNGCECAPQCECDPCGCSVAVSQPQGTSCAVPMCVDASCANSCGYWPWDGNYFNDGIWLPESPPLFRPLIADPREIDYSAGWRLNDQVLEKNVIDVSYGDSIPFYRWRDVGPQHGQLQIELQGALWAVFDPLHESSPLMNADYYVGIPITYSCGTWSYRLRGYHISSHIGDEFLLNHRHFKRKNPSAEYLDFYVSNHLTGMPDFVTSDIRLYGGVGVIVHQDSSFRSGRFYAQAGFELHLSELGFYNECRHFYGRPYFAADFRYQTIQSRHINQTYALGYEWGNTYCLERVFRIFLQYHDGYSYEGQFAHFPTNYFSIRMSYGY